MTEQPTTEQMNEVIARFEGVTKHTDDPDYRLVLKWPDGERDDLYAIGQLKYHLDWNWLLPVVKRIAEAVHAESDLRIRKGMYSRYKPIENELCNIQLQSVHYCVYKFIEWYNNKTDNNG